MNIEGFHPFVQGTVVIDGADDDDGVEGNCYYLFHLSLLTLVVRWRWWEGGVRERGRGKGSRGKSLVR